MKTATRYNDVNEVMTFDDYRLSQLNQPRPVAPTNADKFLVRPPEHPKVLVVKKTPIGRGSEQSQSVTQK